MASGENSEKRHKLLLKARSFLFVPGDQPDKVHKALNSPTDAVIIDLEDGVAETDKERARAAVRVHLGAPHRSGPLRLVRINARESEQRQDRVLLGELAIDAVVVPKVSAPTAVLASHHCPVFALIESAVGLRRAYEIAKSPFVVGLMLGAIDLLRDLGAEDRSDDVALLFPRAQVVRDSIAAGIRSPVDGVHPAPLDSDGLRRAADVARALGMGGKLCIHPTQLPIVNETFSAGPDRVRWAQRVIAAHTAAPQGVSMLDGEMVDEAVVATARRVLASQE